MEVKDENINTDGRLNRDNSKRNTLTITKF